MRARRCGQLPSPKSVIHRPAATPADRPGSADSSAFIQGPRSAGVRAEMRLPSTTAASSTQSTPALTMSSRIAPTLVARRPLRIFAEIGTQPAWQMNAIGLSATSNARTRSSTAYGAPQLVRGVTARDNQGGEIRLGDLVDGGVDRERPVALLAAHRTGVQAGHGDLDAFLGQAVERIEQLRVLEVVSRQYQHLHLRVRHSAERTPARFGAPGGAGGPVNTTAAITKASITAVCVR